MESISQEFKKQINKSYSKLPDGVFVKVKDLDSSEVMSNKVSDLKIAKELPESDDVFSLLDVIIDDEENIETTEDITKKMKEYLDQDRLWRFIEDFSYGSGLLGLEYDITRKKRRDKKEKMERH